MKLDENFLNAQFTLDGYKIRVKKDRNKFGGGLTEYVRKGLICKMIAKSEQKYSGCMCSEITFSKKKLIIFSIYRTPNVENLTCFSQEMTILLTKVTSNYERVVMGDFNIDTKRKGVGSNNLSDFCDLFHLLNIVKFSTCFTETHTSLIDLILTNKPSSFNKTLVNGETGLSHYHKMITTLFRQHFSRLRPKVITYRNYKKFDGENFLNDLKETNVRVGEKEPNQNHQSLTKTFLTFCKQTRSFRWNIKK